MVILYGKGGHVHQNTYHAMAFLNYQTNTFLRVNSMNICQGQLRSKRCTNGSLTAIHLHAEKVQEELSKLNMAKQESF